MRQKRANWLVASARRAYVRRREGESDGMKEWRASGGESGGYGGGQGERCNESLNVPTALTRHFVRSPDAHVGCRPLGFRVQTADHWLFTHQSLSINGTAPPRPPLLTPNKYSEKGNL